MAGIKGMKKEAVKRMKELKLHENVINEFIEEDKVNLSEGKGYLFWLDEEQEKLIKDWEKKTGNLAYHVIKNNTKVGKLLSILYVSKYDDEWYMDWDNMKCNVVMAYVINLDDEWCSEYGSIGITPSIGGLVRIS